MSGGYTKGPWDLRDDDKRISVGIGLVEGPNGYDVAEVYNDDCDRDEAWANARLIAAAPELLQCAERLAALDGGRGGRAFPTEEDCAFARAVIAKAKGTDHA